MIDIPNRFRKLRTDRGFSVYRLSKESDVSENYIHKIERGENQPSVYILEKLLSCLGTTLPEFLNGDSEVMYPSDLSGSFWKASVSCRKRKHKPCSRWQNS